MKTKFEKAVKAILKLEISEVEKARLISKVCQEFKMAYYRERLAD